MTLTISKEGGLFIVDDLSRAGSPAMGRGRTMKEAIGDYFHANQTELGIGFVVEGSAIAAESLRRLRELGKR